MPQSQALLATYSESRVPTRGTFRTQFTLTRAPVRYVNFASVYFLQGWVPSFSLTALFNYLAGHGVGAGTLGGFFGMIGIPWAIQFLWGPIVDQFSHSNMGKQRFWIVLASFAALTVLSALLFIDDPIKKIYLVGMIFVAHSIFASLLDTAIDAQLITWTPEEQRGRMSAVTRGGFVLGGALGAAFFAYTLSHFGFQASVVLLLVSTLLLNLPALFIAESDERPLFSLAQVDPGPAAKRVLRCSTKRFFLKLAALMRTPESLFFLAICFGLQALLSSSNLNLAVQLVQKLRWDPVQLSQIQATGALLSGTIGVALMGFFADYLGHRRALAATLGFIAVSFMAFAYLSGLGQFSRLLFPTIVLFTGLVPDLLGVVFAPVLMNVSYRATVATQFAVFMAITNFGGIVGTWLSCSIQDYLSLPLLCAMTAAVFGLAAFFLRGGAKPHREPLHTA